MYHLAIESSCDETSVAVLQDGRRILSNLISSQIDIHTKFGGVVPEIASRKHLEAINRIIAAALDEAGLTMNDMELVSVTRGPGLVGALLVGVSAAKAISFVQKIPIVGVNHMEGHICANYLANEQLEPPFVSLVISGGHTYLCVVEDYVSYRVVGTTRDDAAGESFDKVARVLGLGYPGGPKLQKVAESGNPSAFSFPRAMIEEEHYDFSFSGLKTAVINQIHQFEQKNEPYSVPDIAASFQQAVVDVLCAKSARLLDETGMKTFCLSGGVAANRPIRAALAALCAKRKVRFFVPPQILCTDNAAMIGCAGYYHYLYRGSSGFGFAADPDLGL
ncbi:MAG: tRNA (adenosine(37)-N6)-threonylcarbamoyltransferase complex transferase subunit TsaD [Ndongobacter sp.]|nr:tRNA (adenosine(37)-N6)-threonylcarbamoyltransferase complex transferase subunit TsaD [Ndongobacter sp.]